ncbi:MAG: YgeY family selenium metabolism-linked hydrolase [Sphaerochaeta sp.]|nr:YgeY family selenium metabolism-linked hydrolase [Sphaerochaeta sp.]
MDDRSLLQFCQKIIGIEGVSGSEGQVAAALEQEMHRVGFDRVESDSYGNVIGMLKGELPGTLMFEGHMDTVGIPDRALWKQDPYGKDYVGGKLYGRGTSDMRCALAAMIHAIGLLAKEGTRKHATILVVGVVQEEIFEGMAFGKVLDRYLPDAVVLGEASELRLMLGQRGRCEVRLETFGKNAHSAHPEKGENAIEAMAKILARLPLIPRRTCPLLGEGISVVTDIISRPYPGSSVIPDHCQITIDRRTLVGETRSSVLSDLQQALAVDFPRMQTKDANPLVQRDDGFLITIPTASEPCYTGKLLGGERFFPAWTIEEATALVSYAYGAMEQAGLPRHKGYYPFCTDGSESAGNRDIPTIGFGPSSPSLAHMVDEYVEFDQVLKAREVYKLLARVFRME